MSSQVGKLLPHDDRKASEGLVGLVSGEAGKNQQDSQTLVRKPRPREVDEEPLPEGLLVRSQLRLWGRPRDPPVAVEYLDEPATGVLTGRYSDGDQSFTSISHTPFRGCTTTNSG
jgi:hypothetical protein